MRWTPSLFFTAAVLALAGPLGAQNLLGDSSLDGTTLLVTSDVVDNMDGQGSEGVLYLLALDQARNPTDMLDLGDWLRGAYTNNEFDADIAARGGRFLLSLMSEGEGLRRLFQGQVTDGSFDRDSMVMVEEFPLSDPREIVLPRLSHAGKHAAWFTRTDAPDPLEVRYTLNIRTGEGEPRRIQNVLPAMDFSQDEGRVAYLERVEDQHKNVRYRAARLVVEPVDGSGEKQVLTYGYFVEQPRRPSLVWSSDGGAIYLVGETIAPTNKRSISLFYNKTPKPRLFRVPLGGEGEPRVLWMHGPAIWLRPSPDGKWIYALSFQKSDDGRARVFHAPSGRILRYPDGHEKAGQEVAAMEPRWTNNPIRPLPVWLGEDEFLVTDNGNWLFRQVPGEDAVRLPGPGQKLLLVLQAPTQAFEEGRIGGH